VAGKKERQRKLAREHYQRQATRRAQRARRLRTSTILGVAACVVVALAVGGFLVFSGAGKPASASATPTPTPSLSASATATAAPSPTAAAAVAEPARHCSYTANGTAARNVGFPPATPDYKAAYQASIVTNRGTVVIDLLNSKATCAVNSFVYLAAKKYFNGTTCHRLTTSGIFVLQCGDPTGTGNGGPGYKFANENLAGTRYTAGTVAMANAGPGTNGSQFFLVYRKNSLSLPASYTPFGTVVKGLAIIQNVAKAGTDNANRPGDGHPKKKVIIYRVTITKT
jgi:peptidyl-prolyl cis-trans isomerase B (cyclophilin B)